MTRAQREMRIGAALLIGLIGILIGGAVYYGISRRPVSDPQPLTAKLPAPIRLPAAPVPPEAKPKVADPPKIDPPAWLIRAEKVYMETKEKTEATRYIDQEPIRPSHLFDGEWEMMRPGLENWKGIVDKALDSNDSLLAVAERSLEIDGFAQACPRTTKALVRESCYRAKDTIEMSPDIVSMFSHLNIYREERLRAYLKGRPTASERRAYFNEFKVIVGMKTHWSYTHPFEIDISHNDIRSMVEAANQVVSDRCNDIHEVQFKLLAWYGGKNLLAARCTDTRQKLKLDPNPKVQVTEGYIPPWQR